MELKHFQINLGTFLMCAAFVMAFALPFAKIKFTGLVSEIRGKLDNVIIQGWKTGVFSVKKMMTAVNNPNSSRQDLMRSIISTYSKQWTDTLTDAQRAQWETYALTEPGKYPAVPGVRQIIPTNNGKMSGINAYCMTNALLITAGMVAVTNPPLAATPPGKPEDVAASSTGGVITVTWTAPAVKEPGAYARIWIASASNKFHPQKVRIEDVTVGTQTISQVRAGLGKLIDLTAFVGELVYIQLDTVNPTGGKSAGSNTIQHVIA